MFLQRTPGGSRYSPSPQAAARLRFANDMPPVSVLSKVQLMMSKRTLSTLLAFSAGAGHVLYPLFLRVAAPRERPAVREDTPPRNEWPPITVLVPAYLESGVIASKIADIRGNRYPGDVEILVVADGDPVTAAAASTTGARVLLLAERGGKSQALNHGMAAASHEYVVFTDANNRLGVDALRHLTRRLMEPGVGAVAGEKLEGDGGELAYWRFESWIKRQEDLLGTTLGLDGGLCAVRRSSWRPIPEGISNDDLWIALDLMDRRIAVAYEPRAAVREEAVGTLRLSWERRTRVLGGSLFVFWRKRSLLHPRRGFVSAQLWGHKLWRSTFGPLSHVALIAVALSSVRSSTAARLFVAGHLGAAASLGLQEAGRPLPVLARVVAQILYLQLVALGGIARFVRRDRVVKWDKPAR
jgi:biofilm PGA synthesis N-glycosyltransferase PgaC